MKLREFSHILAAILIFTAIGSFSFLVDSQWFMLPRVLLFATIIIFISILAKKIMASLLDTDVEHEIWNVSRYGIIKHQKLNKEIPGGIIFPLLFSLFTLGFVKFAAFITYEARALKRRAAKRFGFYSYTEVTEWHNGLIGAAGIISLFIVALIAYFLPYSLEYFSKLTIYYAISNLIPISKLDGTQIFFGSKTLWTALALIALIFGAFAFLI